MANKTKNASIWWRHHVMITSKHTYIGMVIMQHKPHTLYLSERTNHYFHQQNDFYV